MMCIMTTLLKNKMGKNLLEIDQLTEIYKEDKACPDFCVFSLPYFSVWQVTRGRKDEVQYTLCKRSLQKKILYAYSLTLANKFICSILFLIKKNNKNNMVAFY